MLHFCTARIFNLIVFDTVFDDSDFDDRHFYDEILLHCVFEKILLYTYRNSGPEML